MAVLPVVAAECRIAPNHTLRPLYGLLPDPQLDFVDPRGVSDLLHFGGKEVIAQEVPVTLEEHGGVDDPLKVTLQKPGLEERIADLDERLFLGPREVLESVGVGAGLVARTPPVPRQLPHGHRSEEHTSELQSP